MSAAFFSSSHHVSLDTTGVVPAMFHRKCAGPLNKFAAPVYNQVRQGQ